MLHDAALTVVETSGPDVDDWQQEGYLLGLYHIWRTPAWPWGYHDTPAWIQGAMRVIDYVVGMERQYEADRRRQMNG